MLKVLVVDDEEVMRTLLTTVFVRLDCEVETAKDGLEGLEKYIKKDIIVTDFEMPRMNGRDLLRELTKRGYNGKRVLMSGRDLEYIGVEEGIFDYYTQKPIKDMMNYFRKIVEEVKGYGENI